MGKIFFIDEHIQNQARQEKSRDSGSDAATRSPTSVASDSKKIISLQFYLLKKKLKELGIECQEKKAGSCTIIRRHEREDN